MIGIKVDPFPVNAAMQALWRAAWDSTGRNDWAPILGRSLAHVGAFDGERLIGFVNVAWDGGVHAFLLDTCVHPDYRRQGIALRLVAAAREAAQSRGAEWLHVDFEPHLRPFYQACGFRPTDAGLIKLDGG